MGLFFIRIAILIEFECNILCTQYSRDKHSELDVTEFNSLTSLVGQLCWVGNQSRPDISFQACQLSVNLKSPTYSDVMMAKKCLSKMKAKELLKLKFCKVGDLGNSKLIVFTDASFANLLDCGSQAGMVILLKGSNGNISPLYWRSKKIQRVVKSTTCAKAMALHWLLAVR